eukprot:402413-Pyramimonas_sp.AAC.1
MGCCEPSSKLSALSDLPVLFESPPDCERAVRLRVRRTSTNHSGSAESWRKNSTKTCKTHDAWLFAASGSAQAHPCINTSTPVNT